MARLFAGKKETDDVSNTTSKKRFGLFRRGRSESPEVVPSAALKRGTSERKTQSYRISVYEVRSESPTPTCSSTEEGDEQRVDTRESAMVRRRRSPSPKRRQASPLKERRQQQRSPSPIKRNHVSNSSKTESWNEFAVVQQRGPSVSPRRGILKRATFSMADKNVPQKPQAIASFDLELARATSLTDEMSTDPEDNAPSTNGYPLQDRDNSFVIQPKRTVSFSKEVMDPKPKPSGVASLCLGTRSVRRVPRRRGDFSLVNEFEDLCYDLTYFCRCFVDESGDRKDSMGYLPSIPDDDQTYDSSTIDRSVGSI